jgi:hypothetical protein
MMFYNMSKLQNGSTELKMLKIELPPDPTIHLLNVYPKKMKSVWRGHCFLTPSLVRVSFLSCSWLLLNLTGLNSGQMEVQKRHRIDRQKVGAGVLGALVETPNPHCFFSLSFFFLNFLEFIQQAKNIYDNILCAGSKWYNMVPTHMHKPTSMHPECFF